MSRKPLPLRTWILLVVLICVSWPTLVSLLPAFARLIDGPPVLYTVHGKVVDLNGNPVGGAKLDHSAAMLSPNASSLIYSTTADSNGLFSVSFAGNEFYLRASKEGYYRVLPSDGNSSSWGNLRHSEDIRDHPADHPLVLVLEDIGKTPPLIQIPKHPVTLARDGAPVMVDLHGDQDSTHADLKIRFWADPQRPGPHDHYAWRCEISVPGGGLSNWRRDLDLVAPAEGYVSLDVVQPSKENWDSTVERQYFVKTADDHYALVNVFIATGVSNFAVVEAYFNPKIGSRNFEHDPQGLLAAP